MKLGNYVLPVLLACVGFVIQAQEAELTMDKQLRNAIRKGDITTVEKLLKANVDVNKQGYAGFTPLHETVISATHRPHDGNWNKEQAKKTAKIIIRMLLDAGADPNIQDSLKNQTALHHAAQRNLADIVQLLIDNGADASIQDERGKKAFDYTKKVTQ